jgi:putative colanic acid biosysnthesis UDP-glucose lipid carrier transferase
MIRKHEVFGLGERVKRLIDIEAAIIGLILFSPILLITSIAIKLDSQGPIFIREVRYACNNREIQVLKFRVVTTCMEGNRIKARVTQLGQIVSQSGIDELPQFFNVLRGEMSIVGRRNVHRWPRSIW